MVDEAFVELDYGTSEGLALDEVDPAHWARVRADPTTRWPGGESLADVQRRVDVACAALFATDGEGARRDDGDVVVVSHVGPIKAAVGWVLGAEPTVALRLQLDNGSITTLAWRRGAPVLLGYNVVPEVTGRGERWAATGRVTRQSQPEVGIARGARGARGHSLCCGDEGVARCDDDVSARGSRSPHRGSAAWG